MVKVVAKIVFVAVVSGATAVALYCLFSYRVSCVVLLTIFFSIKKEILFLVFF